MYVDCEALKVAIAHTDTSHRVAIRRRRLASAHCPTAIIGVQVRCSNRRLVFWCRAETLLHNAHLTHAHVPSPFRLSHSLLHFSK